MASTVQSTWQTQAVAFAVQTVRDRVLSLPVKERPRKLETLASVVRRAPALQVFAFDPKDVAADLLQRGLIKEEVAAELQDLLQFAVPPRNSASLPPAEWPADCVYSWTAPGPPPLSLKGLAGWVCANACVHVKADQEVVLEALVGPGKLCQDGVGRLAYNEDFVGRAPADQEEGTHPWTVHPRPAIRSRDLTVRAALLIQLPESSPSFAAVQQIRRLHDPAYERWMPHINLIYPFVPVSLLSLPLIQKRLDEAGTRPFDLCFEELGQFEGIGNIHLKPSAGSLGKLKALYGHLAAAAGYTPPDPAAKGEGKGKGKCEGKGEGKGEVKGKGEGKGEGKGKGKGKAKGKAEEAEEPFNPHMTIAKSRHVNVGFVRQALATKAGGRIEIRFQVASVSLCERGGETPFREVASLRLGSV